ncbi:MAG: protein-glutamate O-methyltransferase CheR [Desulfuromonadaceae bacterium]|jgi:chemotaxis protein methyltransferase CheR
MMNSPFEGDFPEPIFAEIRSLLLDRVGFDLGLYKDGCIRRRLARRARSCRVGSAADYLRRLRADPDEVAALMASLTIHVSQFFRNPSTFEYLRDRVLPTLLQQVQAESERPLRIWCAGCAGGEEPYSLALLLHEMTPALEPVLLATDISPAILQRARAGLYHEQQLLELPERLRQRYFSPENEQYRLNPEIRRMVQFRKQNLMTDCEYPQVDLILCRNVLIYFSRAEQERIIRQFARVLPAGGYLVLGRAENLMGKVRGRFENERTRERIYRRR